MDRTIDFVIIAVYLIGVAVFGIISAGKQNTIDDYFLDAKKIPWWIVSFSIVATETSSLTFISIPGLAYLTNLNFLQLAFGFLLGRIFIAYYLLPSYFQGEFTTAYSYLGKRFGSKTRTYASIVFLFTRTAADSVRLFATAIPLKLLLNISYPEAILIIAGVALIYTITGGLKSVIWVDAIQMVTYLGGALLAGYLLLFNFIPGGWESVVNFSNISEKFNVINWGFSGGIKGFFNTPYTLIAGLIGGGLLSMASHGTDQLIVQRLLATKNLKNSQRAIISSGVSTTYLLEIIQRNNLSDRLELLDLGLIFPFPEKGVLSFLQKGFDKIMVVEELDPIIENAVRNIVQKNKLTCSIVGKEETGLSSTGEFTLDGIDNVIANFFEVTTNKDELLNAIGEYADGLPPRPPTLCSGCPHRASYYALKLIVPQKSNLSGERAHDTILCGDIGCSGLGALPPLKMIDTINHMGMSISMAQGLSEALKDKKTKTHTRRKQNILNNT